MSFASGLRAFHISRRCRGRPVIDRRCLRAIAGAADGGGVRTRVDRAGSPMKRTRLTVVLTHPVQYYAPWFRHVAAHAPTVQLTVLYGTSPTAAQQGVG